MSAPLPLSSEAYLSARLEAVVDGFRPAMPAGFAFHVVPNPAGPGVLVATNDPEFAARIIDALEEGVAR